MNMNAIEEKHLTIETKINGKRVGIQELHDPFLHNRTYYAPSIWDRIKLLWTGMVLFDVKVRGDDTAHRQWFRTDKLPMSDQALPDRTQEVSAADAALSWYTRSVFPKVPGVYRLSRTDICHYGSVLGEWTGSTWRQHADYGDYSNCSNLLWQGQGEARSEPLKPLPESGQ